MSRFEPELYARALRHLNLSLPAPVADEDPVELTAQLCRRYEGLILVPYLCPAGVPTIGYGSTHYLDGTAVSLKDRPISIETAERLLKVSIERIYLPAVRRQCPGVVEPRRLAALADFTYNLGEGRLAGSTLRRRVNEDRWDEVPAEFMKWVLCNGRPLRGLVLRRADEASMI